MGINKRGCLVDSVRLETYPGKIFTRYLCFALNLKILTDVDIIGLGRSLLIRENWQTNYVLYGNQMFSTPAHDRCIIVFLVVCELPLNF